MVMRTLNVVVAVAARAGDARDATTPATATRKND
jgi:hypothetical protein